MQNEPFISLRMRRVLRQANEAMQHRDFKTARALAERCVTEVPELEESWMLMSEALAELGQNKAGMEVLERAAGYHPDSFRLEVQRCKFLMGLGRRRECLELVRVLARALISVPAG